MHDLVVRNATIVDGTGAPRFEGDVAIAGGRIAAIGRDLPRGERELDASGKVAAPGFIDVHTHDDRLMLSAPGMAPKVSQGVTTVIAGNCGVSLAPAPNGPRSPVTPPLDLLDGDGTWFRFRRFADYVAALGANPPATNCALLVGHTSLRVQTMDNLQGAATQSERDEMRKLADEALAAGAIGISTGLYYEPAIGASTEEVIDVCRPLKPRGGIYCTHMRDEAAGVLESLEETFRIGREVGVPVVISHHKVAGQANHGRSRETLALIEERMRTQPIALDCYPYCASSTILTWSRAKEVARTFVTWSRPHPEHSGKELSAVAEEMGVSMERAVDALLPAGAIYFAMDEGDVQRILSFGPTMVGSDGLPHDAVPHPRLWGTFPRVLGHYARGVGLFSLEAAIHKMTGLPARNFGLSDRGVLKPGRAADLCIFDADTVAEGATFAKPIAPAKGIEAVIVNGETVWTDARETGARPGKVLRRR